jgi:hypothetical protein
MDKISAAKDFRRECNRFQLAIISLQFMSALSTEPPGKNGLYHKKEEK